MKDLKLKAKKEMLGQLRKKMREMAGKRAMPEGLGVTVKAKDKEGLLKGLEKASEVVESPKMEDMMEEGKESLESKLEGRMGMMEDDDEMEEKMGMNCKEMPTEELEEKLAMIQEELDKRKG